MGISKSINSIKINNTGLTVRDRARSRNVKRWHTCDTVKEQTVADHSHGVGIIAEEMLDRLCKGTVLTPSIEDRYYLLKYAQVHDLPEIICGDMSSVFKTWLGNKSVDFDEILSSVEVKLVPELAIINEYFKTKPYLKVICKIADILESYNFISLSMGLDKQHNDHIIEKLDAALLKITEINGKSYPDLNWSAIEELKHDIIHGKSVLIDFEKHIEF
jgi:5'-deoxynucleotidase YfbR-like HD superfamily hydrolase